MVNIHIQAKGIEESLQLTSSLRVELGDILWGYLNEIADAIIAKAKENLEHNDSIISGELSDSIRKLEEDKSEDQMSIVIGTDIFYAIYVEYGRGPIRPIRAKVLHWIDKKTGKDVFASYAGPAEARPFFEPAVHDVSAKFEGILAEKMNKFLDTKAREAGVDI